MSQGLVCTKSPLYGDADEVHGFALVSCNAGISACEKGGQWQRALALLGETSEARLEPSVILQRLHQRVREWRAVAACSVAAQRDVRGNSKAHRHQLQRRDQRVREGRAVAQWQHALSLLSEMREATWNDDVIGYSAGISACEKGQQWQRALAAVISACEKGEQWQWAMSLLSEMRESGLQPNAISYNAGICACGRCGQWRQAVSLLNEMRQSNMEPDEDSYDLSIAAYERSSRNSAGFPGYLQLGVARFRIS
ncbi:unnamed protein product [Prorocentrum cordatum]|uniref:Pentatricopeptide repeat-containing protein, chloroplastic n=1 Tax=Prorocentrum cordatum TaxID=2364126 RepID=A0ABN9RMV5_9DINO|nr:unnamed protein product [Polarella glacialis]